MKTSKLTVEYDVVEIKSMQPVAVKMKGKVYGGVEVTLEDNSTLEYVAGEAVAIGLTEDSTHGIVEGGVVTKWMTVDK